MNPITVRTAVLLDNPGPPRLRLQWALLIIFCALAAAIGRLTYMLWPFDSDGAMYVYMGKIVSEGGRFCHDLCDNKFPSTALVTGLFYRICGIHWNAYVLVQSAMIVGGILMLAHMAAKWAGRWAWMPTFLFALVYLNFHPVVFGGFQLEALQIFFAILSALYAAEALMSDRQMPVFIAGMAAGLAAMCKPTGLAAIGAFGLLVTFKYARQRAGRQWLMKMVCLAAGVAIPLSGVLAYLYAADILQDMPALYRQISRYASNSQWGVIDVLKIPIAGMFIGFPLFVRAVIFRKDGLPVADVQSRNRKLLLAFAIAWLLLEFIGVIAQRRMYAYHFLVIGAPAALVFGLIPRRSRPITLLAALLPVAILSMEGAAGVVEVQGYAPRRMAISDYIQPRTRPGDTLWMDDEPRLLLETGLKSASRYPITFTFANYDEAPLEYSRGLLEDLARAKPKYIMLPTDFDRSIYERTQNIWELKEVPKRAANFILAWNRIRDFVVEDYWPEGHVRDLTAWRRRGS